MDNKIDLQAGWEGECHKAPKTLPGNPLASNSISFFYPLNPTIPGPPKGSDVRVGAHTKCCIQRQEHFPGGPQTGPQFLTLLTSWLYELKQVSEKHLCPLPESLTPAPGNLDQEGCREEPRSPGPPAQARVLPTCPPCSHLPSQVHSHLHCPEPPWVPGNDHVPMDPASLTSSQPRSTAGKPRASLQAQLGFLVLEVKPTPLLHLEEGATALPLPVLSL